MNTNSTNKEIWIGELAMHLKKVIGLLLLLALFFAVIAFSRNRWSFRNPERAVRNFSNRIERGNLNGLTLTIFYREVSLMPFPVGGDELVRRGWYHHRIDVDGETLEGHIDLLRQISANNLIPITLEYPQTATLYYVFAVNGRIIFGVDPQPCPDAPSMFINGVEFEWNDAFFDVVRPFLPEDIHWRWDISLRPDS